MLCFFAGYDLPQWQVRFECLVVTSFVGAFDGLCWNNVRQKGLLNGVAYCKGDGKALFITLEWTRVHDAFIATLCLLTSSVCIATACLNVCKDSVAPCINIALYKYNAAKNIF
jgi:hypothetical protein